ncbi:SH3 domain-containing protein [Fomitopsis serialis]|uniref:SH3 domain-containing protein n=1 Tax=Fomitopsis serialis TaxID=139415 RepID=UPI002007EDF6|nr:SH3 domain-containing protein [Neoantrodia serialis]KAH9938694.1 SH3 domain-containing protein [Neoantrodia serialis]
MAFSNLNNREKDAFFSLLDEYFSSRPDLLNRPGQASPDVVKASAASALHSAFSKTTPQDAASAVSGFRKSMPPPRPDASASSASTPDVSASVGRVAAAAAAFGASGPPLPRPPPRRVPSSTSEEPDSSTSKLVQDKRFGDVDISSGKAIRANFAPPPVRRVDSTASNAANTPSPPPPPPPRPRVPEPEPEGEWAEALYDYTSDDPGDLPLEEGDRVLIVEKTSDDWWTGEMDGRRGLVPAAYVKVL